MSRILKLTFHLRKLEPAVTRELSLDSVIEQLVRLHSEYKLDDPNKLRKQVEEALSALLTSREEMASTSGNGGSGSSVKVMSMNQILMNQYQNAPSKRHKPESESSSSTDATMNSHEINTGNGVNEGDGVVENGNGSAGVTKKRKEKRKLKLNDGDGLDDALGGQGGRVGSIGAIGNGNNFLTSQPSARLKDLAGIDSILSQVRELVFYPVQYPELYTTLGVQPPCGLLLRGPSGCGKTSLACAIADWHRKQPHGNAGWGCAVILAAPPRIGGPAW